MRPPGRGDLLRGRALAALAALAAVAGGTPLAGQEGGVDGVVIGRGGEPLPLAAVDLLDPASEEPVGSTATDAEGAFSLRAPAGTWILRVAFLFYRPTERSVVVRPGATTPLGTIALEADVVEVEGVVVEADRSRLELGFERRVFRVGEDVTVTGGSVLDVLAAVPSVTTDFDGTISLRGSSAVRVLIDGRPSPVYRNGSRALRGLPADMIERVEVITNPSARYEAEGSAGIVNIVLRKDESLGFRGSLTASQRHPEASQLTANANYRRGAVNGFVNGSLGYAEDPAHSRSLQRYLSTDTAYVYSGVADARETDWSGQLRVGADVHLSSRQVLTGSVLWSFEDKRDVWSGVYADSTTGGALLGRTLRREVIGGGEGAAVVALDWESTLGPDDHRLEVVAEYERGVSRELPVVVETSSEDGSPVVHDVDDVGRTEGVRLDLDYARPLADSGRVEAGASAGATWRDDRYAVRQRVGDGPWTDASAFGGNHVVFDGLAAAYVTASGARGPVAAEVGLRAEHYRVRIRRRGAEGAARQGYTDIFPSAFVTWRLSELRSVQASYSRRIFRPGPTLLLPTTSYGDARRRSSGNPELRPEYGHSLEAQLLEGWEAGSLLASLYYRRGDDVVERISRLDEQGVLLTIPVNLSTSRAWGVELTGEHEPWDGFTLSGSANLFRTVTRGAWGGQVFSGRADRLTGQVEVEWDAADRVRVQSALRYLGPSRTVQGRRDATAFLSLGAAVDLLDGRGTLALASEDLFGTRRNAYTLREEAYVSTRRVWEPAGIRLSFTYRVNGGAEGDEDQG